MDVNGGKGRIAEDNYGRAKDCVYDVSAVRIAGCNASGVRD